jgi:YVTN family beta-propeller protein
MDGGRFWFLHAGFIAWPAVFLAASLVWSAAVTAQPAATPLVLETKIPLGQISGRIDHLGIDVKRQRLFVAELGNNSVGVVDLAAGKVLRTISGLSEPQGVAYVPLADSVLCRECRRRLGARIARR